jgi:hypothetical protein
MLAIRSKQERREGKKTLAKHNHSRRKFLGVGVGSLQAGNRRPKKQAQKYENSMGAFF